MKDSVYDNVSPSPRTSYDVCIENVSRLQGLSRVGIAASDSLMAVDLGKSGYTQLFETMATLTSGLFDPLDDLQKKAQVGIHTPQEQRAEPRSAPDSPVCALVAKWKAVREAQDALSATVVGAADDPTELLALEDKNEDLCMVIAASKPASISDAVAMLEWAEIDCVGTFTCKMHTQARSSAIAYLRSAA